MAREKKGMKHMDEITSFRAEHYFLSNMYPVPVTFEGLTYPCVESAFQAAKVLDKENRINFTSLNGYKAKSAGRKVILRKDWEKVKLDVMYQCVSNKFTENEFMKEKLLNTGDAMLIEGNTWGDKFWGVYEGVGENHLGKILMRVRKELKERRRTCQNQE